MKGKIISIAPKIKDGAHESFNFNSKTLYVFILSVEMDGKISVGDAFSTMQSPKWEIGKEYEINIEPKENATGGNKIKIVTENNYQGKTGKTGYGKPIYERTEIISQSAYHSATTYLTFLSEDERKKIIEKYGPDEAFISFANRISDEIVKNAKRLEKEYYS